MPHVPLRAGSDTAVSFIPTPEIGTQYSGQKKENIHAGQRVDAFVMVSGSKTHSHQKQEVMREQSP